MSRVNVATPSDSHVPLCLFGYVRKTETLHVTDMDGNRKILTVESGIGCSYPNYAGENDYTE